MSDGTTPGAGAGVGADGAAEIRILGGGPDTAEIAAITAVLTVALDELAGEHRRRTDVPPSQWERSQRIPRSAPTPGGWSWWGA